MLHDTHAVGREVGAPTLAGRSRRSSRSLRGRAIAAALALTVALTGAGVAAQADSLEDLRDQQEENALEQERLSSELEGTTAELQEVYLELRRLENEIPIAEAELSQAEGEVADAERQRDSLVDRLAVAEADATTLQDELTSSTEQIAETEEGIGQLARSTYRGSDGLAAISVVLGASSAEEYATRTSAVASALRAEGGVLSELEAQAATQRNAQVRLDAVQVRIDELRVEAEEALTAAEEARAVAEERRNTLTALEADYSTTAVELESFREQIESQQERLEDDQASIRSEIQRIEREREEAARKAAAEEAARQAAEEEARRQAEREAEAERNSSSGSSGSGSSGSSGGSGSGGGSSGGGSSGGGSSSLSLIPPVSAPFYVTSPFGMRVYPITGGRYMHNGTDIRSACGNTQVAAADGVVASRRNAAGNGTHGNQIYIDHGLVNGVSTITVYNHLSGFNVSLGQSVSQGQVIGYTGMTGAVTGCHVHVEVWRNGSPINPESLPGWTRTN